MVYTKRDDNNSNVVAPATVISVGDLEPVIVNGSMMLIDKKKGIMIVGSQTQQDAILTDPNEGVAVSVLTEMLIYTSDINDVYNTAGKTKGSKLLNSMKKLFVASVLEAGFGDDKGPGGPKSEPDFTAQNSKKNEDVFASSVVNPLKKGYGDGEEPNNGMGKAGRVTLVAMTLGLLSGGESFAVQRKEAFTPASSSAAAVGIAPGSKRLGSDVPVGKPEVKAKVGRGSGVGLATPETGTRGERNPDKESTDMTTNGSSSSSSPERDGDDLLRGSVGAYASTYTAEFESGLQGPMPRDEVREHRLCEGGPDVLSYYTFDVPTIDLDNYRQSNSSFTIGICRRARFDQWARSNERSIDVNSTYVRRKYLPHYNTAGYNLAMIVDVEEAVSYLSRSVCEDRNSLQSQLSSLLPHHTHQINRIVELVSTDLASAKTQADDLLDKLKSEQPLWFSTSPDPTHTPTQMAALPEDAPLAHIERRST